MKVFFVNFTAQNQGGGYSAGLYQITVRNGVPSQYASVLYTFQQLFKCLTYPTLDNKFLTTSSFSYMPDDISDSKILDINQIQNLITLFEKENKYNITL